MGNATDKEIIKVSFAAKRKHVKANLRIVAFKDGDYQIAYIPSLNVSAYGRTEEDAMSMLSESIVKDYLLSLIELPEAKILAELREYGWQRSTFLPKQLSNVQFLSTEKIKENFNLPAGTRFDEKLRSVTA